MKFVEQELLKIKIKLQTSFDDPLEKDCLKNFVSSGSKFIRSKLAILYLKSHNIEISNDILNILISGEIIHNASLLHDDVIDNADFRRGKTSISKEFSPKISILAGDFLISKAIEILLEIKNFEIIKIFKDCTQKMSEAEIKQFFLRKQIPSKEEYLKICEGKTATLFSSILESCAIISGIQKENARIFGKIFGTYFQIKNDLDINSSNADKLNNIYTAKDILGIENTKNLLDNYIEEMSILLEELPNKIYKKELEDLIQTYDK